MRIYGTGKISPIVQKIRKKFVRSKALILMYHRIANIEMDPWSLSVAPHHFGEQLAILKKYYYPLTLRQLAQTSAYQKFPKRAVIVTFDDGYVDNLLQAKPILEHYQIPATVFIVTGSLGTEQGFWWDALTQLVLKPGRLPQKLTLTIENPSNGNQIPRDYHWNLGEAVEYSPHEYQRDRMVNAHDAKHGSRLHFFYSLWQTLLPLEDKTRQSVLNDIISWIGDPIINSAHRRALTPAELLELSRGDLIEIGAHTVTHPLLSAHEVAVQEIEIQQSKIELEKILNRPINSFSYPFGNHNKDTVELVQKAGFKCACTTSEDIVWRRSNHLLLPRFQVQNWDGETFNNQLRRWFDGYA